MNHTTVKKPLIGCGFIILISLFGCSNSAETINKTANKNSNQANIQANINVASPTPVSAEDLATKTKIEDALKKAGFTNIEVDATTTPISIRGTVDGDKMAEIIFVAEQASGKKLKNELKEKK